MILLVMQSFDNSLTSYLKGGWLRTRQGVGEPNPDWIPLAHEIARDYANDLDGFSMNIATDILNIPATAHYIGGCTIGESARRA